MAVGTCYMLPSTYELLLWDVMLLGEGLPFNLIYPRTPISVLLEQPDLHSGAINWMTVDVFWVSRCVSHVSVDWRAKLNMNKEMVSSNWWSESHEEDLPARLIRGGREECGETLLGSRTLRRGGEVSLGWLLGRTQVSARSLGHFWPRGVGMPVTQWL